MNCSTPGLPVHHQLPEFTQNSCPLSRWCHPAISSSVVPFSSCPQSLPASGSFPMSQPFAWGGQSIGVSVSASVLPMNTQDLSPSGWTGWISLQSKGLSRVFSNTTRNQPRTEQCRTEVWACLSMPGNQLNDEIERALLLTRERRTKVSNSMITGITVLIYSSWEFTITQWKSLLKAIHSHSFH